MGSRTIESKTCLMCKRGFDPTHTGQHPLAKTRHHVIPKMLKPERNLCIWLHRECHDRLNGIYVHQNKKPRPVELNIFINKLMGMEAKTDKFHREVIELIRRSKKEITDIHNKGKLGMINAVGEEV